MKADSKMKLVGAAVALGMVCAVSSTSLYGQAAQDPKITGTYVAAIEGHSFAVGGDFFDVRGVLFSFVMGYDPLGYHVGLGRSGVMFAEGRRFSVATSASVPPFPDVKNRNIDIRVSADISGFGELVASVAVQDSAQATWAAQTILMYGKTDGFYFTRDPVTYQSLGADMNLIVEDPSGDFVTQADMEALRVSPQILGDTTTRIKIRR